MVNETPDRYPDGMDKEEHDALAAELAALADSRTALEASLKAVSDQSLKALVDALKRGMKPAEVARNLRYTDGYVRKVGRKNGIEPDPRYADLKPPVRTKKAAPTDTTLGTPAKPPTREDELLSVAAELTPGGLRDVVAQLADDHGPWVKAARTRPGAEATDWDLVAGAIRAGLLNVASLRAH